ncbi:MAG: M48 family metalloprotease [Thermodesulfobacteriota bacterium]
MSYNNLLYILVVIFLLSAHDAPAAPHYGAGPFILLFICKLGLFSWGCRRFYRRGRAMTSRDLMRSEQFVAWLAISSLAVDIFWLDGLYYAGLAPLASRLPLVGRMVGLALFFLYLAIGWYQAAKVVAHGGRPPRAFVLDNLRATLPIVIPWIFISLVLELLALGEGGPVRQFLNAQYGEIAVLAIFFLFLAIIYPPLLMRLWHCRPLPASLARDEIVSLASSQGLAYNNIMVWPLLGGQAITAGIIGFWRYFRYVLVTPALLKALSPMELQAVMAHEIGHVKRYHMQLYLLLLIGFSIVVDPLLDLLLAALIISLPVDRLLAWAGVSGAAGMEGLIIVLLLVILVLYLRLVFAFFLRNFERQADLHAFTSTGNSLAIVTALEKVGRLSGDIRDLPNWHHFGIGQRADFLLACKAEPSLVAAHHRKVNLALVSYLLVVALALALHFALPPDLVGQAQVKREMSRLSHQLELYPDDYLLAWGLADRHYQRQEYAQALYRYDQALAARPNDAELLNNLAWLLITCEDEEYRDGPQGLLLARKAARLKTAPHILDTLAHAYWLAGRRQEAVATQARAVALAPGLAGQPLAQTLAGWRHLLARDGELLAGEEPLLPGEVEPGDQLPLPLFQLQ